MQETASNSPASSSFASIIASLAKAASAGDSGRPSGRDEDVLADDLITLSYERALRHHARYHPSAGVLPDSPGGAGGTDKKTESDSLAGFEDLGATETTENPSDVAQSAGISARRRAFEEIRKSSSITIRLTEADCAQLRLRAGEAGLTVSAYLRSCAFEVEDLRAQVKDALAQLRKAVEADQPARSNEDPVNVHTGWRSRIFAHWRRSGPAHA